MPHFEVAPPNRRNARRMRKVLTDAELTFWNAVRAHRLMGLGFRRQMPIAGFIVDFACPDHHLIAEIDGPSHTDDVAIARDAARDRHLRLLGWHVLRFSNDDVTKHLDDVCTHVLRVVGLDYPGRK
ncbi:endonuclease domain-containing protein [Rhizobium halophytocola]|nr:endonuclease domain-containing protein [Rhizobium halophytocola]